MLRKSVGGVSAAALITGVVLAFGAPVSVGASPISGVPSAGGGEPEANIVKAPRRRTHSRRAVFRFRGGDKFACSLDRDRYRVCESPHRITGLSRGRTHRFRVRAVLPNGGRTEVALYRWRIRY